MPPTEVQPASRYALALIFFIMLMAVVGLTILVPMTP
jgi:hypothetical protein